MPELPEVETVRTGLEMAVIGHDFRKIWVSGKKLRKSIPKNIEWLLNGRNIESVERRAKYLLVRLSGELVLVVHLGMSGQLVVLNKKRETGKHDHFIAELSGGLWLYYTDPRRFGVIDVLKESEVAASEYFRDVGPEPLEKDFTAKYLQSALKTRSADIKLAIMDQKVVVGVGNIYASEALFRSGINPNIPANKVSIPKLELLVKSIRDVLKEAIKSGGSTLRDYVRSTGDSGYFQHSFKVYGRDGKPCAACKTARAPSAKRPSGRRRASWAAA